MINFLSDKMSTGESQHVAGLPFQLANGQSAIKFFGQQFFLSNFHPAGFTTSWPRPGTRFHCSEQAYMARRAMYFGDEESLEAILLAPTAAICKALGKKIVGFDPKRWEIVKERYMKEILLEKFGQNWDLKKALMETGSAELIESCQPDKFWGNGIDIKDDSSNKLQWKGLNKLGQQLMEVREMLKEGSSSGNNREQPLVEVARSGKKKK